MEALATSLMGFFQKRKFRNCLMYIAAFDIANPSTWDGMCGCACARVSISCA
jgi:hypothetical protein